MKNLNLTIAAGTITAILSASSLGLAAESRTAKATGVDTPVQELVVDQQITRSEARNLIKSYLKEKGKKQRVGKVMPTAEGWKVTVTTLQKSPIRKYVVNSATGEIS